MRSSIRKPRHDGIMANPKEAKMNDAPKLAGENLEQAIAAQPFPKVTKDSIEAKVAKVDYLVLPDSTVTLCNITLKNGYSVRGESACVDPRNFNVEIGKGLAYKQAFDRLWPLEGYLLAEQRFQMTQPACAPA